MDTSIIKKDAINALTNKELKKNLNTMSVAFINGKKSSWQYAFALNAIVKGEEFKDDFKSLRKFSEFIGTSPANMSQLVNAVDFVKKMELVSYTDKNKPILDTIVCSAFVAYLYSQMTTEEYVSFSNWVRSEKEVDALELSQNIAKAFIKEFKELNTPDDTDTDDTDTDDTDTDNAGASDNEPTKEQIIENIKALMEKYNITIDDLK